MGNIHPNDIGLATFKDVGDVAKLRTAAKTVVEAINELFLNGGQVSDILGEQLYVDGNGNTIIGTGNIIRGENNLIIGSDNVINGNNLNIIADGVVRYEEPNADFSMDSADVYSNALYLTYYNIELGEPPFKVGDKIVLKVSSYWYDEDWESNVTSQTDIILTEIVGINTEWYTVYVADLGTAAVPPDDVHTEFDFAQLDICVVLNENYVMNGNGSGLSIGGMATGAKSVALNTSTSTGVYAFSANSGQASGMYATALGLSKATKNCSFSANRSESSAESTSAHNYSFNYSPYSFTSGYYSKAYGRVLKVTGLDTIAKTITLEDGQNVSGIKGFTFAMRCLNGSSTIVWRNAAIESVTGNVIKYTGGNFSTTTSASYKDKLLPEAYLFVYDTLATNSTSNFSGGYYSVASGKYTFAEGLHVLAGGEGSAVFGKYGNLIEPFSLALANGNSLTEPGFAFKVLSDGSVHADKEYTTPCADYAEFFEWEDGNPEVEDRTGYFVKLSGEKIVKCGEFEKPLGIVSATPAIIGDSGEMHWKNKYVTDDFGRIQYHDVIVPAEYDDDMNLISEEHMERQPVLNPEWNCYEEYVPRKKRAEWSPVGVLGKLVVYDDGTLKSGDICRVGDGGIAVKSIENGYHVLSRVSADKVLIWFKE